MRREFTLMLLVLMTACTDTTDEPVVPPVVEDTGILAWVNEVPVHDEEVTYFLEKRLNLLPFQAASTEMRERALRSLVTGRAMAQLAERQLTPEEQREVELATAFFREDWLTKRYIKANTEPTPISEEKVVTYYNEHSEEFGARVLKEIEWISTPSTLPAGDRETLLSGFQALDGVDDWEGFSKRENRSSIRTEFRRGTFSPDLLADRLQVIVAETPVGATSGLHMIGGELHRIRVLSELVEAAQPLSEVRADIRQRLAPIAMRESVKEATEGVTSAVSIRYAQESSDIKVEDKSE